MKKVLFAVLATAALASCTQSDIINESDSSKKAISFDESYIGKNTRAVPVAGVRFAEGATIGVFSTGATSATDNFDNQKVTFDAGAWIYNPQKFYEDKKTYTFNAYTPWKEGVTSIDAAYTNYVVAADVTAQEDLMYAAPVENVTWDGQASTQMKYIQFTFKHALTQVKFSARTISDYSKFYTLKVKKLTVKGIESKGTALDRTNGTWTVATGAKLNYVMTSDLTLSQSMNLITTATNDIFMLMPQTLADAVEVDLVIDVQFANSHTNPDVTAGDHTITATIPASTVWARNQIYHYQLNLDLDDILKLKSIIFGDPKVEDWAPEETFPSIVPEPTPAP